jgi:hypothetical protein
MTKLIYEIIKHDGGWAYRVDETVSEPGESTIISYEDKQGHWHQEASPADDRPKPIVRG